MEYPSPNPPGLEPERKTPPVSELSLRGAPTQDRGDVAISREEIARRVEAELEVQLKEIQPPPNELFKQLWRRVLEIKHDPELNREQKERAIAEAKLQSLVGHHPVVHSSNEPKVLTQILRSGVWSANYAEEHELDTVVWPDFAASPGYKESIYTLGSGIVAGFSSRKKEWQKPALGRRFLNCIPDNEFNLPELSYHYTGVLSVWDEDVGVVINIHELQKDKLRPDYSSGGGVAGGLHLMLRIPKIDPHYLRGLRIKFGPYERGQYRIHDVESRVSRSQEPKEAVASYIEQQRRIFGDQIELYLPIIGEDDEILWPPAPEESGKKSSEK